MRNCTGDEGWPLGAGLQGQASKHLKLLWSKAMVVSIEGKGLARQDQLWIGEASASEPSDEVSKMNGWRQNWWLSVRQYLSPEQLKLNA